MIMKQILTFIALFATLVSTKATTIYQIDIRDEINSKTWIYTKQGFSEATELDADVVLINLNTYGGEVIYADSIRTTILNSKIPVIAFINNNAASAGALISIACDQIYMRPGASFGATTVVNGTDGQQMPDKYQSYMRATMRSTAEAQGKDSLGNWKREPLIAEAMVDDRTVIPNLIDSGKTLTFTTEEAMKHGYCEGTAENIEEVLTQAGYAAGTYTLHVYEPSTLDSLKGILTNTFLQSILIMLIIGGIYFELQTPGIGFPLAAAVVAAILYFAPLYIDGLAASWEIILFAIGVILIILEIFVIPGFGLAGISGILLVVFGLTMSMIDNVNFNFENVPTGQIGRSLFTVMLGLLLGFVVILYLTWKIGTKGIFRKLALETTQETASGFVGVPTEQLTLVGKTGVTTTDLRPSGKVEVDGKRYDAVADNGAFISKGAHIKVVRYVTGQVYVVPTDN